MTTRGLLARLDAAAGREAELEKLLFEAQTTVEGEPATVAWFALRFGHGEYAIFDAFPDDAGRQAHLAGGVVAALAKHRDLLDSDPQIETVDVLADKLTIARVSKGLLLRLPIKSAHASETEDFLRAGQAIVAAEPGTTAWFAIKFDDGDYGVFDVFPDRKGRRAHLLGEIPKQLALRGLAWLGGLPDMSFVDVLAQKL